VLGLIVEPILVPVFLAILLLEGFEALALKKLDEQANGRVLQVFRCASRRRGVEGQRVNGVFGNGARSVVEGKAWLLLL